MSSDKSASSPPPLRSIRIVQKGRKKKPESDEPVCIALSSDEEDNEEEMEDENGEKKNAEGEQDGTKEKGKGKYVIFNIFYY